LAADVTALFEDWAGLLANRRSSAGVRGKGVKPDPVVDAVRRAFALAKRSARKSSSATTSSRRGVLDPRRLAAQLVDVRDADDAG
jgi:hypothetical protein